MITAYVRVSTEKQDLESQKKEIIRYATSKDIKIDCWVEETISGTVKRKDRQLEDLLSILNSGDTLIITEISRLSRTLLEILFIMEECIKQGIHVHSVKDGYTFDNSISSTVLIFAFGLVSEVERKLISVRTKEALLSRKIEGKTLGRPQGARPRRNILVDRIEEVKKMLALGVKIGKICADFGVSRNTFERFRAEYLRAL